MVCVLAVFMSLLGGCRAERASAERVHTAAGAGKWYENEIRAFERADAQHPPERGQVLFVGSSSFRLWKTLARDMSPAPVINRGFGGSATHEVLEVFDRVVAPYEPAVIVYYCGDNDLGTDGTDWERPAINFIEFYGRARAKWPRVEVFYVPIKASLQRWKNWPNMKRANAMVEAFCAASAGGHYLDTVTPTLMADGTPDPSLFESDGLHINEKGYERWTKVVRGPVIEAWEQSRR